MKILLIGGHLTPALAMIDFVQQEHPQDSLVFVGRQIAQRSTGQPSREQAEVEKRQVKFITFETGKLHHPNLFVLWQEWWKWLGSLPKSWQILAQTKPDVVLSFGGYLAVPICVVAWVFRVPVVTHEQTSVGGVANKLIGHLAKKVAIADAAAADFFPAQKVVLTGNPLRQTVVNRNARRPDWLAASALPLLYISGGSQGSQKINEMMLESLDVLCQHWQVVHQVGPMAGNKDWKAELESLRQKLPKSVQNRYVVREWVEESELAWLYPHMDLMVGRSGANTVWELQRAGVPALYLPLAKAHFDEQTRNAQRIVASGAARILPADNLNVHTFLAAVEQIRSNLRAYQQAAKQLQKNFIDDAAAKLYQLLADVVQS